MAPQQAVDLFGAQVDRAGQEITSLHLLSFQWPVGRQPLERAQVVLKGRLGSPDLPAVAAENLSRQVLRVAVSVRTEKINDKGFFRPVISGENHLVKSYDRERTQDGLRSWRCAAPRATDDDRSGRAA